VADRVVLADEIRTRDEPKRCTDILECWERSRICEYIGVGLEEQGGAVEEVVSFEELVRFSSEQVDSVVRGDGYGVGHCMVWCGTENFRISSASSNHPLRNCGEEQAD
jgi:ATP-dependent protease ClpP protease subunit